MHTILPIENNWKKDFWQEKALSDQGLSLPLGIYFKQQQQQPPSEQPTHWKCQVTFSLAANYMMINSLSFYLFLFNGRAHLLLCKTSSNN